MSEFTTDLRDKFAAKFPTIDMSDINTGYNKIEDLLVKELRNGKIFTPEQWEAITDWHFSGLFQDGSPHSSWNTDRSAICRVLISGRMPYKTYPDTWDDVSVYSIQNGDTVLEVKVEEPRIWGQGRTQYHLSVAKVYTPVPTHRAVIIKLGEDTRAHIANEFAGSEQQCENWVAAQIAKSGGYFKIIPIPSEK